MKFSVISIALILLSSVLISFPLTESGLFMMHDDHDIARLFVLDEALKAGQFPVRWVNGLGFGYGYPLFNFYPPFVYMLGELFHLIGFNFINSVKLVFFTSILFSGLAMYIFVKEQWGKFPAIVSALFYLLVPYRAIDVYIRGALAESFSFVWLPLILWSLFKLYKSQKLIYVVISAVFLSLLMLTHNLIFLPFMLILPIYLLFLVWYSQRKIFTAYYFLLAIVLAMGLSAFFWIPALLEKKFTIVDQLLLVNLANYNIHFVYLQQLWNWPWGFGGSAEGLMDGISFKIGKLHIISSIAAVVITAALLTKNLRSKLEIRNNHLIICLFILLIFSAFMTTIYSKFIWDLLQPLAYLQFPWRFLIFTALFSSILSGALVYLMRTTFLRLILGSILILLLIIPNVKLFQPQDHRPYLTEKIATLDQTIKWDVSSTSYEYIPNGVTLAKDNFGNSKPIINKSTLPEGRIEILSGNAETKIINNTPNKLHFGITSAEASEIKANIFNFPGWEITVDGKQVPINDNNDLKLITFGVDKGSHNVEIDFVNTPLRTLANLISIISLIAIITILLKKWQIKFKSI